MAALPRVVRILASVRLPSGYGPDVDYEMVHAIVRSDADPDVHTETVILRFCGTEGKYRGGPVEVLVQDLPVVQAEWGRFVAGVFERRAEAGDREAQLALDRMKRTTAAPAVVPAPDGEAAPIISASGGRYGLRAKVAGGSTPESAPAISSGPRKAASPSAAAPPEPPPPEAAAPPPPEEVPVPQDYQVIGFNLSMPPSAEGILGHIAARPHDLIVVAPANVAAKAETYINELKAGQTKGRPGAFSLVIVRHPANFSYKKLRAELAAAIVRVLGELNSALWIVPE